MELEPASRPSQQELETKHWAIRVNIKSLADALTKAADDALAGKLKHTTFGVRKRAVGMLSRIMYQMGEIVLAQKSKR